ncbi:helix-turn-helix domain-containing protein [Streptomyces sp. NPDC004267]|uniref:helix-turn-helix domain-containing protein n=1 Tax=Streptomyces sp. NPDC004267 TaxID=3364694 RepID=UPI003685F495
MEALAVRLSGLDPYVDGAIRIVAFYDTLMRRRVDLPALARASAGLAECVAGIRLHGTGHVIRMSPEGTPAPAPTGVVSTSVPVTLDDEEIGTVWLERADGAAPAVRGTPGVYGVLGQGGAAGVYGVPGQGGAAEAYDGPRQASAAEAYGVLGQGSAAEAYGMPGAPLPVAAFIPVAAPGLPVPGEERGWSAGREASGPDRSASAGRLVPSDGNDPPRAPRATTPAPSLDEVLLDRLAIAVAAAVERYGPARTTMADPALVELAVSADCDEAARARALRLLGFAPGAAVRVVAVRSRLTLDDVGARLCPEGHVKAAPLGDVGVVLATAVDAGRLPADVRAGIGDGGSPERSWRQARTALRFATAREPVIHHAELGALALLAEIPAAAVRENPDVEAVARIAAGDRDDLDTLDAYCHTGSLRRAAELLHRHHSSVARRVEQLTRAMGFDVTEPAGLGRARIALSAWRLLESR